MYLCLHRAVLSCPRSPSPNTPNQNKSGAPTRLYRPRHNACNGFPPASPLAFLWVQSAGKINAPSDHLFSVSAYPSNNAQQSQAARNGACTTTDFMTTDRAIPLANATQKYWVLYPLKILPLIRNRVWDNCAWVHPLLTIQYPTLIEPMHPGIVFGSNPVSSVSSGFALCLHEYNLWRLV